MAIIPRNIEWSDPVRFDDQDYGFRDQAAPAEITRKVRVRGGFEFEFETYEEYRFKLFALMRPIGRQLEASELPERSRRAIMDRIFDRVYDFHRQSLEALRQVREERGFVEDIRAGDAVYRLRRPLGVTATTSSPNTWSFEVDEFSPRFVGEGASLAEARSDWERAVHSAFQSLVRLRPFRMSDEQRQDWDLLQRLIDVEHYWKTTPVKLRELGFVSAVRRGPCQVTWLDGMQVEDVTPDQMPREFAGFAGGQWFEAIVERDPGTHTLRRVCYVQPVEPLPEMSEEELKSWYHSLPKADTLPPSDSDWSTL